MKNAIKNNQNKKSFLILICQQKLKLEKNLTLCKYYKIKK